MRQPSILEVRKNDSCHVCSELNELKVARHLFFDPLVLHLHSHKLTWGLSADMDLMYLC
jgi:hypothetical protein